jgi:penicillin-binding protein 1A
VRVVVANPRDGGFFYWLLKLYAFGAVATTLLLSLLLCGATVRVVSRLPSLGDIASFRGRVPLTTRIYAWDGQLLAELARERRDLAEPDEIPPRLAQAFVAAEDRRFYEHRGVDVRGVLRAALQNLRAGGVVQGGSTITQQLAKAYLGPERTLSRKLREAILAFRLEQRFSKQQILFLYLNTIFLGNGTYGVRAAAGRYLGKDLSDLTLDEMAFLAGLARAPSRTAPPLHMTRALRRRDAVLDLMEQERFITPAERDAARAAPLRLAAVRDPYPERAPYYAEHVRRELLDRLGRAALYDGGLRVETAADLRLQSLAGESIDTALRRLDKRQGWRGPVSRLPDETARAAFRSRAEALYGHAPLDGDRLYLGLVETVTPRAAWVRVGGGRFALPLREAQWAFPYTPSDSTNDLVIESLEGTLQTGDVLWVRPVAGRPGDPPVLSLEQTPYVQGAIFTFDHQTGYALALVGGRDFDLSTFDRVSQACRQPGSTFKPIYYSFALDHGYTMATVLQDRPYVPEPGEVWNPANVHGTLDGQVLLRTALVRSLNLPSIQLFNRLGADKVAAWARRLGLTTPIHADRALALGASCTRMDELGRAFATFARGGTAIDPLTVRRVIDRHGHVLVDNTVPEDPWLDAASKLDRLAATLGAEPRRVIDARTAYLTSRLLRDAVVDGLAARAGTIGAPAAGKGGTSSDTMDVWFVGYTSRWLTTAWIGDDTYRRPLGTDDASYTITIPMWADYMRRAIGQRPLREIPWQKPRGVVSAVVDIGTGQPVEPGMPGVRVYLRAEDLKM